MRIMVSPTISQPRVREGGATQPTWDYSLLPTIMQQTILYSAVGLVAIFSLLYARLVRGISYPGGVPRVGKSGTIGYILTALKYTFDAESVILKGRAKFFGHPFVIPTLVCPTNYLSNIDDSL
ncbi:hypothetical protein BD779DRAFT_1044859 [Infundibulicybe gibba]|nr:hypothetical protein BD779DRAFT_1044859 [Infundibulicybe gibba]